jgi:capsular exopolysaccharide synthesis family protein
MPSPIGVEVQLPTAEQATGWALLLSRLLRGAAKIAAKWWWLLVASTMVSMVTSYYAVSRMPRIYEASTIVMVGEALTKTNPDNEDFQISQQLAQTYSKIATGQSVLSGAADALGLPSIPRAEDVSVQLVDGTQLLGISVRDTDPERARTIADAIAQELIERTPNEVADGQFNRISVFEPASKPTRPISPNVMLTVLMAAVSGMFMAFFGSMLIEYLAETLETAEDIRKTTGLPALGIISAKESEKDYEGLITVERPHSIAADEYRTVWLNIQHLLPAGSITTLAVASVSEHWTKTLAMANLGVTAAQAGRSVILVDADLRFSALHRAFQLSNGRGVADALMVAEALLDVDDWLKETEIENLRVLTSGPLPPSPWKIIGSQNMQRLIQQLKSQADIVFFETPPVLLCADSAQLALQMDGIVLVAEWGRTRRSATKQAVNQLQQIGINVLGIILIGAPENRILRYHPYQHYRPRRK